MENEKINKVIGSVVFILLVIGVCLLLKEPVYYLFTNKVDNIEVYSTEFENISLHNAVKKCDSLGKGWRLPTIKEIEKIDNIVLKLENFTRRTYWSSNYQSQNSAGKIDSIYTYEMRSGVSKLDILSSNIRLREVENENISLLVVRNIK